MHTRGKTQQREEEGLSARRCKRCWFTRHTLTCDVWHGIPMMDHRLLWRSRQAVARLSGSSGSRRSPTTHVFRDQEKKRHTRIKSDTRLENWCLDLQRHLHLVRDLLLTCPIIWTAMMSEFLNWKTRNTYTLSHMMILTRMRHSRLSICQSLSSVTLILSSTH